MYIEYLNLISGYELPVTDANKPTCDMITTTIAPAYTGIAVTLKQWRTKEFFSAGIQQIQLRTEGRENRDVGR
jgi:hypothetical protein